MSKSKRSRAYTLNVMPYTAATRVQRWQMCAQLGSMLYRSSMSNDELAKIWEGYKDKIYGKIKTTP